jgi:hypothetical protein
VRHLLPLALLALVPILLAPAGSAKPTPTYKYSVCIQDVTNSPACGTNANSVFAGNSPATVVRVTVANDSASSTAIQSASINLPDQLNLVSGSGSSANVTTGTQQVTIHGVKIQPGKSFSATFQVNTACGGDFPWPAQAAYSGDNGSGTPFGPPSSSTGLTTHLNTRCYLAFIAQPTDTELGGKIAAGGASQGGPITVGLFKDGSRMSSCPVGFTSNCKAIVGQVGSNNPPDGTLANGSGSLTQPLTGSPLLATFSDLAITGAATPEQFRLTATGGGSFAPTVNSGSFLIADDVSSVPCTGGGCQLNNKKLSGSALVDSFADLTGASGFTFMTLSPYTLGDRVPAGCANRISAGVAGFAESDGRAPGSPLTIRYYVNKDQLKARYGKNVGEQFIPICAGGRPVDPTTHEAIDCTQLDTVGGNSNGWAAQKLTNKGTFAGVEQNAICDADGYYWGILSSYQDKIPTGNPVVLNWGGQNINGANYRFFDIYIPGNWDWRSGP